MNQRYEDEREIRERQYNWPRPGERDEPRGGGPGYGGAPFGRREQAYRGPGEGYGRRWGWPDQVWSGEGRFDEGAIGREPYTAGARQYGPREYSQAQYGPTPPYDRHYHEVRYGRRAYGEGPYGQSEYGEPSYIGSLYRGERHGEEPYREHEWQQSKEPRRMLTRLFARGPKGYTRSDERIKEDVSERLWHAEHIDSSEVTVAVKNGVVTLTGTVPERWMRHEIENIADSCLGVQDIENNIRVQRWTGGETNIGASSTSRSGGR